MSKTQENKIKDIDENDFPFLYKYIAVFDKTDLSDSTKENYRIRLGKLVKLTGKDINWVLANCKKTIQIMDKNGVKEPQSVKALLSVVVALFKHVESLKGKYPKSYKCWYDAFLKINDIVGKKYNTLQPSKKQLRAYVAWVDVLKKRDGLDKDSDAYLLLCLYTMIPPARADLNMIRIFRNKTPTDDEKEEFPNFLLIEKKKSREADVAMTLVYNEFKSKGKKMQLYQKPLPAELVKVIEASLKNKPRDFLIVSPKNKKPFDKPNSYTKYFNRVLKDVFKNDDISINTLRHSFIMSIDLNKTTPEQKQLIAKDLMHSTDMMDRYRYIMPASKSPDGKEKICDVVCKDA